jgi:hypothetical protein
MRQPLIVRQLLAGVTALMACGGEGIGTDPGGRMLFITAGGVQTGVVGEGLSTPLTVRVTNLAGRAVAGDSVRFSIPPEAGTLSHQPAVTDEDGFAYAGWTLPTRAGGYRATAVIALDTVVFVATATAGPGTALQLVGGGDQTGVAGQALADRIVVRVVDRYGNAVVGTTVAFVAPLGNGTALTPLAQSDASGSVSTAWVLGDVPGPMELRAKVANLGRIFINATAMAASP